MQDVKNDCGDEIADDKWFIQATAHAQKVMGVSMRIMSHAVEGQDSNLINNSSNTEEIEFNCDQSINQSCVLCAKSCVQCTRRKYTPLYEKA